MAQHAHVGGLWGKNVIGLLPGHDPVLRNETVIVGAHYDHLGLGGFGSLDPDSTGKVHNGADDNASGAAMLIQIAARLAQAPPARTVLFIAFSGEELGLLGSAYYVKQPIYPAQRPRSAMINLDMVGRLRNNRLIVYGVAHREGVPRPARLAELARRVRSEGAGRRLRPERPVVVLRGGSAGAAHLHRPARGLPPHHGRLGEDRSRRVPAR